MQRRLLRASISPMNVRPFSVSRKQSRRLPSWLTTPSKHHPDGPSHRAACSVLRATYVQHESCNMHQCSMQHTTLPHAAHTMPHRPFDKQHELHMHSAPCNPRQGTRPPSRHAAWCFDRPTYRPMVRRIAGCRHGTSKAGPPPATSAAAHVEASVPEVCIRHHNRFGAVCRASRNEPPAWL
jgi:hypothetical protein